VAIKRRIAQLIAEGVDPRAISFCPCEMLTIQDLRRIVRLTDDLTPGVDAEGRYWFFDEITYVRQWAIALKQLRDGTILRDGCVVATGSSAADLRSARGDLGGREGVAGGIRVLFPMGFRPFLRELYPALAEDLPWQSLALVDIQSEAAARYLQPLGPFIDELVLAWERYLTVGGFPSAVADIAGGQVDVSASTARSLWNILVGDALRVGKMSDRDVKALLTRLVDGLCSPLSVAGIAGELAIGTRNTVADRIDRICAALYGWRAAVSHDGIYRVAGGQDKLYFIDPLIARLPSVLDRRSTPPDETQLSEQQLGNALLRTIASFNTEAILDESAILVRRNPRSGAEIDFTGDLLPTPIESKYTSRGWKRERAALDEHYKTGIIATRDILDTTSDIWAIPAALLAWMINDN
jgi:predicted AAA+ superfamily ATPase